MSSTNAIDLSKLAAPSLVEELSFETLLQERKLDFAARCAARASRSRRLRSRANRS